MTEGPITPSPPTPPPPPGPSDNRGSFTQQDIAKMVDRSDMKKSKTSGQQGKPELERLVSQLVKDSARQSKDELKLSKQLIDVVKDLAGEVARVSKELSKASSKSNVRRPVQARRAGASVASAKAGGGRAVTGSMAGAMAVPDSKAMMSATMMVGKALSVASKGWQSYSSSASSALGEVHKALMGHRQDMVDMSLNSWLPDAMKAAIDSVGKYGVSWREEMTKVGIQSGATKEEIESLASSIEVLMAGIARKSAWSMGKVSGSMLAAAETAKSFKDHMTESLAPILVAMEDDTGTMVKSIENLLGTAGVGMVRGLIKAAQSGETEALKELRDFADRFGNAIKIDDTGTTLGSAFATKFADALYAADPTAFLRAFTGDFEEVGEEIDRGLGKIERKLNMISRSATKVWDVFREPANIAGAILGSVVGQQALEIWSNQSQSARALGAALGDTSVEAKMWVTQTDNMIKTAQEVGADLTEITKLTEAFGEASGRVQLDDYMSSDFMSNAIKASRGVNVQLEIMGGLAAEVAFQTDITATKALPSVFKSIKGIQKQYSLTGEKATEIYKSALQQVIQMRRFVNMSRSALDAMVRIKAAGDQFKLPDGADLASFLEKGATFMSSMQENNQLRMMSALKTAENTGRTVTEVLSGALLKTDAGVRALARGGAEAMAEILRSVERQPKEIRDIVVKQMTGLESFDEAVRFQQQQLRSAMDPAELFKEAKNLNAEYEHTAQTFGTQAALDLIKERGYDSKEALMQFITDNQGIVQDAVGMAAADAIDAAKNIRREAQAIGRDMTMAESIQKALQSTELTVEQKALLQDVPPQEIYLKAENVIQARTDIEKAANAAMSSAKDTTEIAFQKGVADFQSGVNGFANNVFEFLGGNTVFAAFTEKFATASLMLATALGVFSGINLVVGLGKLAGLLGGIKNLLAAIGGALGLKAAFAGVAGGTAATATATAGTAAGGGVVASVTGLVGTVVAFLSAHIGAVLTGLAGAILPLMAMFGGEDMAYGIASTIGGFVMKGVGMFFTFVFGKHLGPFVAELANNALKWIGSKLAEVGTAVHDGIKYFIPDFLGTWAMNTEDQLKQVDASAMENKDIGSAISDSIAEMARSQADPRAAALAAQARAAVDPNAKSDLLPSSPAASASPTQQAAATAAAENVSNAVVKSTEEMIAGITDRSDEAFGKNWARLLDESTNKDVKPPEAAAQQAVATAQQAAQQAIAAAQQAAQLPPTVDPKAEEAERKLRAELDATALFQLGNATRQGMEMEKAIAQAVNTANRIPMSADQQAAFAAAARSQYEQYQGMSPNDAAYGVARGSAYWTPPEAKLDLESARIESLTRAMLNGDTGSLSKIYAGQDLYPVKAQTVPPTLGRGPISGLVDGTMTTRQSDGDLGGSTKTDPALGPLNSIASSNEDLGELMAKANVLLGQIVASLVPGPLGSSFNPTPPRARVTTDPSRQAPS